MDRAHRLGQTRTVHVTRLVVPETIESRILALQEEKRQLATAALGADTDAADTLRFGLGDLLRLFNVDRAGRRLPRAGATGGGGGSGDEDAAAGEVLSD